MRSYGSLTQEQKAQLEAVVPTGYGYMHRPCRIRLRDGRTHDYVYVAEASAYYHVWGVWPEDDDAKRSIPIEDVVAIEESPYRIPAELARQIYKAGETGMGYFMFTLKLADGRSVPCLTGDAVDFPRLPDGVTGDQIVDVTPGRGNPEWRQRQLTTEEHALDYAWCLYQERDTG